jgi:hypothetical protein
MNPDTDTGYLQDLDTEIRLFTPTKKIKIPNNLLKSLSVLFEDPEEQIQEKLHNAFIKTNDFISSNQLLPFDAALLYSDKLNLEIENYNSEILQLKYSIKKLIVNISSAKLYQIYFNENDFLSVILQETVQEMAEEAGIRFIDLHQELIKASSKAQIGDCEQSQDFYKTVNSYLVCSCSYFDTELIKRKFFNKTADSLRETLREIDLLSIAEKETIALAALSSSESGLDLVLETTVQHAISRLRTTNDHSVLQVQEDTRNRHEIQCSLWQKAKLIIKRIKTIDSKKQKLQNSILELELV